MEIVQKVVVSSRVIHSKLGLNWNTTLDYREDICGIKFQVSRNLPVVYDSAHGNKYHVNGGLFVTMSSNVASSYIAFHTWKDQWKPRKTVRREEIPYREVIKYRTRVRLQKNCDSEYISENKLWRLKEQSFSAHACWFQYGGCLNIKSILL